MVEVVHVRCILPTQQLNQNRRRPPRRHHRVLTFLSIVILLWVATAFVPLCVNNTWAMK
jgi:hypothetical protein